MKEEYFRKLFRFYRKQYGNIKELLVTNRENEFWANGIGEPVCSLRTIYNIEGSEHKNDQAVLEFLIKKMGYKYPDIDEGFAFFIDVTSKIKKAITSMNYQLLEQVIMTLKQDKYAKEFLFSIYHKYLLAICYFYLFNTLKPFTQLVSKGYPDDIFFKELLQLKNYLQIYYHLLIENDFKQTNLIIQQTGDIPVIDLYLVCLFQVTNLRIVAKASEIIIEMIANYAKLANKHYKWLLDVLLSTDNFVHNNCDYQAEPYLNLSYQRVKSNEQTLSKYEIMDLIEKENVTLVILYLKHIVDYAGKSRKYKALYDTIIKLMQ